MDKKKTGNLIKEARNRKNYTQSELGNLIGVSNKAVSKWENGESFPDVGVLENLASVLDIRIQDIVTGDSGITGENEANDDSIVAEVVRVAKLQQKEKKHKLIRNILVVVAILCCIVCGVSALGNKVIIDSPIAYAAIMTVSFVMILVVYAKQRVYSGEESGNFQRCTKVVAVITLIWCVLLTWSVCLMLINGYNPFRMELSSVGPFVDYQLIGLFVINIILLVMQLFRLERNDETIHWGWFISVATIFVSVLYGDWLHRISSAQNAIESLGIRTGVSFLITGIFLTAALLIRNRLIKYKSEDESSMDKS